MLECTSHDSDSTNGKRRRHVLSQSDPSGVDTASLCAGNDIAGQLSNLPLWGCFGNTNECVMAKHARQRAIPCQWRENKGIRCGLYGAPEHTEKRGGPGVWDNAVLELADLQELESLMEPCHTGPCAKPHHPPQVLSVSGMAVFKLSPEKSYFKMMMRPH